VVDPDVRAVVVTLRRRREPADVELLAYKEEGRWVDIKSADINDYIQEHIGDDFTAKDFRTWVGTVLAAAGLATQEPAESEVETRRLVAEVVKDVAEHLGNTPAVARSAYIDPRVVDRFEADDTIEAAMADVDLGDLEQGIPEDLETAVLGLIERARRRRPTGRRPRAATGRRRRPAA
jgi:DNA topoisomerase IB